MLFAIFFVTYVYLYAAYAQAAVDATRNGTRERVQVEARVNPEECNRRTRRCQYPAACRCPPLLRLGRRSWRGFFYNPHFRMCQPNAERYNCNAFRSFLECEARCSPAAAAR
ncbi:R.appendiculatus Kunitz/BPTI-like protein [Rhipicephalus microplus]|uniref:R.appendiculatus Kunitz/BPTI-like protein n=1 Tax=Rhipicephalus microplus TaxID=6941 RepID=UPI003F6CFEF7